MICVTHLVTSSIVVDFIHNTLDVVEVCGKGVAEVRRMSGRCLIGQIGSGDFPKKIRVGASF